MGAGLRRTPSMVSLRALHSSSVGQSGLPGKALHGGPRYPASSEEFPNATSWLTATSLAVSCISSNGKLTACVSCISRPKASHGFELSMLLSAREAPTGCWWPMVVLAADVVVNRQGHMDWVRSLHLRVLVYVSHLSRSRSIFAMRIVWSRRMSRPGVYAPEIDS